MKRLFILFISITSVILLLGCNIYDYIDCSCISCADYGYAFHFCVDGENGELTIDPMYSHLIHMCNDASWHEVQKINCADGSKYVSLLGGKKGSHTVTFTAIPNEGYQVKEWLFNGKVVEGNKTNTYDATVTSENNYNGFVAVRFEPIPNITE